MEPDSHDGMFFFFFLMFFVGIRCERPVRPGEWLIDDGRLVAPPAVTGLREAPAVKVLSTEEAVKYGITACPACDCVLEEKRIAVRTVTAAEPEPMRA